MNKQDITKVNNLFSSLSSEEINQYVLNIFLKEFRRILVVLY